MVAERVGLDAPAALVDLGVRVLHHMKRVSDLSRITQRVAERLAIRARHVEGSPVDLCPPWLWLRVDPRGRGFGGPALYDLDELGLVALAADVDDRGGPALALALAASDEQGLVEPQRLDARGARRISGEQRLPVGAHCADDRVPVTVELMGDLGDWSAGLAT